jgi:hypothetical protein
MKNYSKIVNYKVWEIVDDNVQNIVGKQIRNIVIRYLDNIVRDTVLQPVWGIRMPFAVWRTVDKHHNLFKYNPIQQYRNNI